MSMWALLLMIGVVLGGALLVVLLLKTLDWLERWSYDDAEHGGDGMDV